MTTVNIAFSGGVESAYLLQMALERGFKVNICMINVNNSLDTRISEIIAMEKIIKVFREKISDDQDYLPKAKQRFTGMINDIMHMPVCPFPTRQDKFRSVVTFDVTQQFAAVLGMLMIRREYMDTSIPSCWIGWIKQDAAETSFNEVDFTEDEYQQLLTLPKIIGPLSNADNIGVEFRAPLWDMPKSVIYDSIIDEVKPLLIPNGTGYINWSNLTVTHVPFDHKLDEWKAAGIPSQREYVFNIEEASWMGRYCSGTLLPQDVELEDTPHTREILNLVAPFFCKGRTLIRPRDVSAIKSDIPNRVSDLIRSAQLMAKLPTKEELREAKRKEHEGPATCS